MKILLPILLLFFASPAFAQDAKPPADIKECTALAKKFHEIRPLGAQINLTLKAIADSMPENERVPFLESVMKVFNYKQVEDSSVKLMAETFTPAELKAMIDYYSKPEGKSAAAKMGKYQDSLSDEMRKAMDAAMVELKYPKK